MEIAAARWLESGESSGGDSSIKIALLGPMNALMESSIPGPGQRLCGRTRPAYVGRTGIMYLVSHMLWSPTRRCASSGASGRAPNTPGDDFFVQLVPPSWDSDLDQLTSPAITDVAL